MKRKSILLLILTAVFCSAAIVGCSSNAKLSDWTPPVFQDVDVGAVVFLTNATATDQKGNVVKAEVSVVGPKGAVSVSGQTITAADAGVYNVIYSLGGVQKVAQFRARSVEGGNGGNNSNTGTNTGTNTGSATLGALTVTPSDDPCFSVSGNTVNVLRAVDGSAWQSIGWASVSGWSMANGAKISITINNTSVQGLQLKYKFVDLNNSEAYDDIAWDNDTIAVGTSKTWSNNIGAWDIATPTGVKAIELFVAATSTGQFSISASLSGDTSGGSSTGGNGSSSGNTGTSNDPVLGAMKVIEGSGDYFAVSGNTVTVKKSVSVDEHKSVGWKLSGWSAANGSYVSLTITNNTGAPLDIKYKAVTNEKDAFHNFAVAADDTAMANGETKTWSGKIGAADVENPSSVTAIELFVGATSTGSFTVSAQLSGTPFDNGGSSTGGNGGSSSGSSSGSGSAVSSVLGAMKVIEGSGDYFSVSGKNVTVKQTVALTEFKSVGWELKNWTPAKGEYFELTVKNNTNAPLEIRYKAITNEGQSLRYLAVGEYAVPAGEEQSWSVNIGAGVEDPSSIEKIELFFGTGATGTINVNADLAVTSSGASSGCPATVLGSMFVIEGSTDYFSVSGSEITIKQTVPIENDFKSVGWDLNGWTAENGKYLVLDVTNNTSNAIEIRFKAIMNNGSNAYQNTAEGENAIKAGETRKIVIEIGGEDEHHNAVTNFNNVKTIELFIGAAATGKITIKGSLTGEIEDPAPVIGEPDDITED